MLDFADITLQEQLQDNSCYNSGMVHDGSQTMAAKPIKSPQLHYIMIQFLMPDKIQSIPNAVRI